MATAELEVISRLEQPYREVGNVGLNMPSLSKGHLEEAISLGVFVYQRLKRLTANHVELMHRGEVSLATEGERSNEISAALRTWLETTRGIIDRIRAAQASHPEYRELDQLEVFVAAFQDVSLMSLDTERVKRSIASLHAGQGVTFEQAMEELRANLR